MPKLGHQILTTTKKNYPKGKKSLGQSLLQELEEGLDSGLYLLVAVEYGLLYFSQFFLYHLRFHHFLSLLTSFPFSPSSNCCNDRSLLTQVSHGKSKSCNMSAFINKHVLFLLQKNFPSLLIAIFSTPVNTSTLQPEDLREFFFLHTIGYFYCVKPLFP